MSRVGTGESVLARAVRIFEAFTPQDTTLRVSEIAARTGLHLATASRLVAELVEHGLLARDPDRGVRIGVRMWELALRASLEELVADGADGVRFAPASMSTSASAAGSGALDSFLGLAFTMIGRRAVAG